MNDAPTMTLAVGKLLKWNRLKVEVDIVKVAEVVTTLSTPFAIVDQKETLDDTMVKKRRCKRHRLLYFLAPFVVFVLQCCWPAWLESTTIKLKKERPDRDALSRQAEGQEEGLSRLEKEEKLSSKERISWRFDTMRDRKAIAEEFVQWEDPGFHLKLAFFLQ